MAYGRQRLPVFDAAIEGPLGCVAATLIGRVQLCGVLCQFDADARAFGNQHAAILVSQGRLDHGIFGAVQAEAWQLLNTQVGDAGADLQTCGSGYRAKGVVGNYQHIIGLCNGADLFGGGDAANGTYIGTYVLGCPTLHQHLEFLQVDEALAGGNGDAGLLGNLGHGVDVVRGDGIFQNHGAVRLHFPGKADGFRYGHAPVNFQNEVKIIAYRFPADTNLFHFVMDTSGEEFVPAVVGGFHRAVDENLGSSKAFFLQFPIAPGQTVRIGLPINEGPAALVKGKNAALVFSASGSWTDDYCLGLLTLTGEYPLDPDCWEKHQEPVFTKVHGTYGPGHCCFTTGYDGSTWIIYHANLLSGTGWVGRSGRIQPVAWDGITLELGEAARPGKTLLLPVRSGGDS